MFVIKPGRYTIPALRKRIDTSVEIPLKTQLDLYEYKLFPFITITPEAVPFLKQQKLSQKRVAKLIMQSQSPEEVRLLLEVKDTKTLKKIALTKISSFEL